MKRKIWILIISVTAIALAGLIYHVSRGKPVSLKTITLKKGGLEVTVSSTTTSMIKSEQEAVLSAQRSGRVTRMVLKEGDEVKQGAVLLEIDREEANVRVLEAGANLQMARARLAQIEAGVNMERIQTDSQLQQAKATLDNALREWERQKEIYNKGISAKSGLDKAEEAYLVAKAQYERALGNLDINKVKQQEIAAGRATVQQMEAALQMARIQLSYSAITAPFKGVISKKWISQSEFVSIGSPLMTLVDPLRLYIHATIDEVDVKNLKPGQKVKILIDAFPDQVFSGVLKRISPIVIGAKQETRTFDIWVYFEGTMPAVKPGMSADIEVITDYLPNVLAVPTGALLEKEGKKMIYTVEEDRVTLRTVEIGLSNWNDTEIKKGLKEGEIIVENADGNGLKEGVRVQLEQKQ
ncbi:MAG: efflux RND transporter periplasmic adaptor subunit [Desulfobacteraceae bacterium]|nr:MAG: efflux RND transporter periplasmic adaptor subunit [Desulfobacteraceae bacterium]